MAIYKSDIVDINLESGSIHRSYLNHTIGSGDNSANRFGVRTFRNGLSEDLSGASCQAIFMNAAGTNIALTSYGTVSGNEAYVTLPQACYNVEGQFTLAIKLVKSGETVTTRIVDGVVCNTGTTGAVAPTSSVPTYQEILSTYDAMVAATAAANGAIAATYSSSSTYAVGDYCIHDGGLYRCTTAITTGEAWTAGHWTAAKIGTDLTATKSALSDYQNTRKRAVCVSEATKNINIADEGRYVPNTTTGIINKNANNTYFGMSDYIDCESETEYTVSLFSQAISGLKPRMLFLDASANVLQYTTGSTAGVSTFTSPSNAVKMIAWAYSGSGITPTSDSHIQIEKGSVGSNNYILPYDGNDRFARNEIIETNNRIDSELDKYTGKTENLNSSIEGRYAVNTTTGAVSDSSNQYFGMGEYIDCDGNTLYTVTFLSNAINGIKPRVLFVDSSGNVVSYNTSTENGVYTFTTPSSAKKIIAWAYLADGIIPTDDTHIIIEKGNGSIGIYIPSLTAVDNFARYRCVTPEMFGAVGDGITDDTEAIQEAGKYPFVLFGNKTYIVSETIDVYAKRIIGIGAKIKYIGTWTQKVLNIIGVESIVIDGLEIDANSLAAQCIYISSENALNTIVVKNCIAKNTDNASSAVSPSGIYIHSQSKAYLIKNNVVSEIRRTTSDPGVIASVGIHVDNIIGTCRITNNYISGVYFANDSHLDADGIHAYAGENSAYCSIEISNNYITNCQGRFIKVHGENAVASNNQCVNMNIATIDNFAGIDMQTGKGMILNNTLKLIQCELGANSHFVQITGREDTSNFVNGIICENEFYSTDSLTYMIGFNAISTKNCTVKITENRAEKTGYFIYLTSSEAMNNRTLDALIADNSFFGSRYLYRLRSGLIDDPNVFITTRSNFGITQETN